MPIHYIDKYTNVFVETGTFYGDGIQAAIDSGYKTIVSIEIYEKYFNIGTQRFIHNSNVKIVLGDSALILGKIIKDFQEPITFWLDGHCSGEGTGIGIKFYPLLEELEHIKNHSIKNHIIMIDDVRLWKAYDKELNITSIINKILRINSSYSFYYMDGLLNHNQVFKDDILIAKID